MELAQRLRAESKLSASDSESFDKALPLEIAKVAVHAIAKLQILVAVLQVNPDVVVVHVLL